MVTTHAGDMQSVVTQEVLLQLLTVERASQYLCQPQFNVQDLLAHTDRPTSSPFTLLNWVKCPTLSKHVNLKPLKERFYSTPRGQVEPTTRTTPAYSIGGYTT